MGSIDYSASWRNNLSNASIHSQKVKICNFVKKLNDARHVLVNIRPSKKRAAKRDKFVESLVYHTYKICKRIKKV